MFHAIVTIVIVAWGFGKICHQIPFLPPPIWKISPDVFVHDLLAMTFFGFRACLFDVGFGTVTKTNQVNVLERLI